MILETYLKRNNSNLRKMHMISGIPETTVRNINKRNLDKWSIEIFDAIAKTIGKERYTVIMELEKLEKEVLAGVEGKKMEGRYNLENRRYIGNKKKLMNWISQLIDENTEGNSFFDVFAGTGIVTKELIDKFDSFVINDFLYSNNIIYTAFFGTDKIDVNKIYKFQKKFQEIQRKDNDDSYFSKNFGGKFFSKKDAEVIGEIRTLIEKSKNINKREKAILIASLIYSVDKIANTVGHYDAYRKKTEIKDRFVFELITPVDMNGKHIDIYQKDSNELARHIRADVAFVDPPYNSRQYSRFYHVLEGIAKWTKPELEGVAMKPPAENMSDYSKSTAPEAFEDLISNLQVKYIVVTYNNTYLSKSKSSKNKITHEEILNSLNAVGETKIFEMPFQFFNAGKSELMNHKEFVFITKVKKKADKFYSQKKMKKKKSKESVRSPLFYVGDKYKLMPQLTELFPNEIKNYYDVFCGGGSASINVSADAYFMNDIDDKIIELHTLLQENSSEIYRFIDETQQVIKKFGLSLSEYGLNNKLEELKQKFPKTYFAKYNKESYLRVRNEYNKDQTNIRLLYLLLIYGFNRMIRFNGEGEYNLPVGNVDWNKNVTEALENYAKWYNDNKVNLSHGLDFEDFVYQAKLSSKDFLYFDPPYLITFSDYNKLWNEKEEKRLYNLLDELNNKGIKWGLSNMLMHKGRKNEILEKWIKKYIVYNIDSNYISRFDNTRKKDSREIYVTNILKETNDKNKEENKNGKSKKTNIV